MEIGETLNVVNRDEWRAWLTANHDKADDIWLIYSNKQSGRPRIAYSEAVEEALCFGWIDSIAKKYDADSMVQRFSPRRKNSQLSELNKVRVKKMIEQGRMTSAGLQSINHHVKIVDGLLVEHKPFIIPEDIIDTLKKDPLVWENFNKFSDQYRQIRIAYIDSIRSRPLEFTKRLNYYVKMTRLNKKFGTII